MPEYDHPRTSRPPRETDTTDRTVDPDELLSLLGDEYTREILTTLGNESLPAIEIVDRSGISRPTVYRRLNRLEAAGVVEAAMTLHPDGQHRKEFRVAVDGLELPLGSDGDGDGDSDGDGTDDEYGRDLEHLEAPS